MGFDDVFPIPNEWLTEVDRSLVETTARWAEQEVVARRLEFGEDYDSLLGPAIQKLFVEIGLQSLLFSEKDGGSGLSAPETCTTIVSVLEEVGRADVGIGVLLANTLAFHAAAGMGPRGSEDALDAFASTFCGSKPAVCSLVLPGYGEAANAGSTWIDGLAYPLTATADGDTWTLSGAGVRPQCAGRDAALLAVVADADGAPGLFVVSGDAPGLSRGEPFLKTGLAASRNADLAFAGVTLSADALVFADDRRYRALLARYHAFYSAICSGSMLAGYAIVKDWSENRVIKGRGQVFKDNPLVASLLGKIGTKIATGRMLVYDLARLLSDPERYGDPGSPRIATIAHAVWRTVGADAMDVLNHAMELMASAGYATEWNLERYWRDVMTLQTLLGPETESRATIARNAFGSEGV